MLEMAEKLQLLGCWSGCFLQAAGSLSSSLKLISLTHALLVLIVVHSHYSTPTTSQRKQPLSQTKIVSCGFQTRGRTPASTLGRCFLQVGQPTSRHCCEHHCNAQWALQPPSHQDPDSGKQTRKHKMGGARTHGKVSSVGWREKTRPSWYGPSVPVRMVKNKLEYLQKQNQKSEMLMKISSLILVSFPLFPPMHFSLKSVYTKFM